MKNDLLVVLVNDNWKFKLCFWNISSREILINQQCHRLSWRFHYELKRNLRRRWWLHLCHLSRLDGCDASVSAHRDGQSSARDHYSRDDWVRTFELTTSPRERYLKQSLWRPHTGKQKVHRSWSERLAIWMMTVSSTDLKIPTNVALLLTSKLRCLSSLRSRVRLWCDDDTCMDWLVSCKGMDHQHHPKNLIPLSSSPLCRATLLYSYSLPKTMQCWSNLLSFDDDLMTRPSPKG